MNKFEQRLQKRVKNREIAEGYQEIDAEMERMRALNNIRKQQHMSQPKKEKGPSVVQQQN